MTKKYTLFVSLFVFCTYLVGLNFILQPSITKTKTWNTEQYSFDQNNGVKTYLVFENFDPESASAKLKLYPRPGQNKGASYRNSFSFNNDTNLYVDSLLQNVFYLKKNEAYGAIDAEINLYPENGRNIKFYPFDKYKGTFFTKIYEIPDGFDPKTFNEKTSKWNSIPHLTEISTSELNNFAIIVDRVSAQTSDTNLNSWNSNFDELKGINESISFGSSIISLKYFRDYATIFLVVLTSFIMVGASLSVLAITISIYLKKRKVSIQSFIWSTAVIFTIIQLRENLPGDPKIGIFLDLIIYFPSILLCSFSTITNVIIWMRRDEEVA